VSALAVSSVRTASFGDLDAGVWGFAWGDTEQVAAVGAARPGDPLTAESAGIAGSEAGEDWVLTGPRIELCLSPQGEAVASTALAGFHQLCRVQGDATIDGSRRQIDLLGVRSSRSEPSELGAVDSIREVSAWFGPGEGLALSALRPSGAKGHDRDLVSGAVFDSAGALSVADPRLSTTYTAAGRPARVGLELWLEQEDSEEQYPRRAAGEALGASAGAALSSVRLQADLFRCRSRGAEGIAVYLLAQPG
jgi:hypothetical protein